MSGRLDRLGRALILVASFEDQRRDARFVSQAENVLVFGPPGVGKTHLPIDL